MLFVKGQVLRYVTTEDAGMTVKQLFYKTLTLLDTITFQPLLTRK